MAASVPFSRNRILEHVARYWGFDQLRPLQEEAIQAGFEGRDSVVVLPTGGGKSLCYQVPPLLAERTDVVVSPLISLMKDQVDGLRECGYPAGALHSGMSSEEQRETVRRMRAGDLRLIFVSPERVLTSAFISLLDGIKIGAFAIDEAHCISHWGHDFRLDYRQLAELKKRFPQASVHAYTATATDRVRRDIAEQLNLNQPAILVGNFDRPNLTYRIVPRVDVHDQAAAVVSRHKDEGVIIYCLSRNDTERMADDLQSRGIEARPYHAGMDSAARTRTQDAFAAETLNVVTATVAFGMGIDRSNVRCVIHATMPKSIEHYQQETGRAGRDGLEAECVLFYSAADVIRWESLLGKSSSGTPTPPEVFAAQQHLLDQMRRFCSVVQCRHRRLMEYFGQTYTKSDCEACDSCLKETEGTRDGTVTAQQILSCVARVKQRFGVVHVVDVLRGADTAQVRSFGHNRLSTYGILKETPQKALTNYVYQLVDHGLLERTADERPVLRLADASWEVIRGERSVMLMEPVVAVAGRTRADRESWEGVDRGLFDHLRGIRRGLATEREVPAFVIFSDATLRDLARHRPGSPAAFRGLHGIGAMKAEQFAVLFLEEIGNYCKENELSLDPQVEMSPGAPPRRTGASPGTPPPAAQKAFRLFEKGATVQIVATALDRAPSTVEGYLVDFIARAKPKSIAPWVDESTYLTVVTALKEEDSERLKPVFERLDGNVPYAIIRLVAMHLRIVEAFEG